MATATAPAPIICRDVLRARSGKSPCNFRWRRGPDTEDGFWMLTLDRRTTTGENRTWAVRVVIDPTASVASVAYQELELALMGRLGSWDDEDAYLASVNVVRMLPPDDLTRLRDAVLAGRTGGADDGAPRKRTRKAGTAA